MENSVQVEDDLPPEARDLVEKVGLQIGKLRDKTQKDAAAVQQKADREIAELNERCQQKVQAQVDKLAAELKPLQQSYAREGKLDEALAIRAQINQLQVVQGGAEPDPGTLVGLQGEIGKSFLFDVVGETSGPLWGTDVYTSDSSLAAAAVHAGKVRPGERKAVRVTIVQPPPSFKGSTRNGVTSSAYGPFQGAFRVG